MFSLKRWKIRKLTKKLKALKHNRLSEQPRDEVIKKEISYYFELAALYKTVIGKKKFPYAKLMLLECYRAAAALDDSTANFNLGYHLLEEAKYRDALQKEGLFDSQRNEVRMSQLYEEAHAYLKAAEQLGHIEAKRLRGLCYINGWGVDVDKEGGFELIVASIEQEGSWDRVPQIFAAIGLNKPEFFSAIMQRRKGQ
ncbi:hypothetical protein E3983_08275 [Legionella israelensis]|uniref:Sel1 repeat family protein n=1 Tax=Legionella israelensis TaxID=454 RepID=A0A0W0VGZ3_9GAMM|nr:hypothetical protein [Legionella israelensis]KTD19399.1 hypothetical protein Lisr_1961 [Legionella israelensis]QBR84357.1 hypothetical protein E3983_08275 [Legionella israelensis]QBS08630.1 hypothetical protein E4T55_01400 [Legionella israelensis]QDP72535.1 hypothetical protein FOG18_08190 [Legionella israelensis]SCY09671.1 hypothetical protein SAMN02746069_01271 [Legionella israelensis DSM 19235]